jgi:hypothetical protein
MREQSPSGSGPAENLSTAPAEVSFGEDIETKALEDHELAPVNADSRVLADHLRESLAKPIPADTPPGPKESAQGQ